MIRVINQVIGMDNKEDIEVNSRGGTQTALNKTYVGIPIEGIDFILDSTDEMSAGEELIITLHRASSYTWDRDDRHFIRSLTETAFNLACQYFVRENEIEDFSIILGIPSPVWDSIATTRYYANIKYGEDNWKLIEYKSHLDHAIAHVHKYISGDTTEKHLDNIVCRIFLAMGALKILARNPHE